MKIVVKTQVGAPLKQVKDGFTQDLFLSLNPPFPPVKLLEFGGCKTGDQVVLELNFILFKQKWISEIIEDEASDIRWHFVDVGRKLPFFLKSWTHGHIVEASKDKSIIIDDITYTTGTLLTDLFMYPLLSLQFLYRKPIYKRVFKA